PLAAGHLREQRVLDVGSARLRRRRADRRQRNVRAGLRRPPRRGRPRRQSLGDARRARRANFDLLRLARIAGTLLDVDSHLSLAENVVRKAQFGAVYGDFCRERAAGSRRRACSLQEVWHAYVRSFWSYVIALRLRRGRNELE